MRNFLTSNNQPRNDSVSPTWIHDECQPHVNKKKPMFNIVEPKDFAPEGTIILLRPGVGKVRSMGQIRPAN